MSQLHMCTSSVRRWEIASEVLAESTTCTVCGLRLLYTERHVPAHACMHAVVCCRYVVRAQDEGVRVNITPQVCKDTEEEMSGRQKPTLGTQDSPYLEKLRQQLSQSFVLLDTPCQHVDGGNKPEIELQTNDELVLPSITINKSDKEHALFEPSINALRISFKVSADACELYLAAHDIDFT